jgi:type I restriction enzyme M protein
MDEVFANVQDEVERAEAEGTAVSGSDFRCAADELTEAFSAYSSDRTTLESAVAKFQKKYADAIPETNAKQHAARQAFDPIAEGIKGLIKQLDLAYKLAARTADVTAKFLTELKANEPDEEVEHFVFDRRRLSRLVKELEVARKVAVEQLKHAAYFHRQVVWLQDRFPDAKLQPVPGLVKAVTRAEIEAADWSLTPGR